jgi:hypothetical protein
MNLHNEHSSRHLRLRWHISANELQLKALKLTPPNSLRSRQFRQLEHERALLEAELRLQGEIDLLRKYDPDQPREPAGIPEGGQWTDGGQTGNGGQNFSKPTTSPLRNAVRTISPFLRRLPEVGPLISLIQLLDNPEFAYPIEEALDQYNSAVANKDKDSIPSITFRARAFEVANSPQRVFASMKELTQDEARRLCPRYMTVQTQTDIAKFAAGPLSAYKNRSTYGTAIHSHLQRQIETINDPDLKAEQSYMKYIGEVTNGSYPKGEVTRGIKGSLRIDVLEKASPELVCVYDVKTGPTRLGLSRIKEISYAVTKNFGESGFTIIEMRPGQTTQNESAQP